MGIVQRQGIKNSLVNYFGVIIGALSTLFIYPLDLELYGRIQIWFASASLLVPFLTFGSHSMLQKFYPYFKNNNYKGFFKLNLQIVSFFIVVTSIILYVSQSVIFNSGFISEAKILAFKNSLWIIYPLAVLLVYLSLARTQTANLKRIVVPDLLQKIGLKILIPIIFLSYFYSYISFSTLKGLLLFFHLFILVFLIVYLKNIGGLDISTNVAYINAKKKAKEIWSYTIFSVFNQIGTILAYQTDKIMLGFLIDSTATGIYAIFFFLSGIIDIPTKAIYQISAPLVSQQFQDNEIEKTEKLYKQTSLNLLLVGVFIFSLIILNFEFIFNIMSRGEEIRPYKYLFYFLGIAKLMDMVTSLNGHIMIYSKYYRYNILFVLFLGITNVITNYFLIKQYGIVGTGIATAITIVLYNTLRTLFIYVKLKIHPFSVKEILLGFIFFVVFVVNNYLILPFHFILNSMIVSTVFIGLYIVIVYIAKVSLDVNKIINKVIYKKQ